MVETARRYGRIYQTGVQRLSEANFVQAIELARLGAWPGSHGPGTHRALGCRRDEPCVATGGAAAAKGRGRLGRLAGSVPDASLQ